MHIRIVQQHGIITLNGWSPKSWSSFPFLVMLTVVVEVCFLPLAARKSFFSSTLALRKTKQKAPDRLLAPTVQRARLCPTALPQAILINIHGVIVCGALTSCEDPRRRVCWADKSVKIETCPAEPLFLLQERTLEFQKVPESLLVNARRIP